MKSKAIFLDRDGVINKKAAEHDYIKSWDEFVLLPDVLEFLTKVKELEYSIIVVTNQRGVAKNLFHEETLIEIHTNLNNSINGLIDAFYYCIHDHIHNCLCRKPKPGMLLQAAKDLNIDLKSAHLIGDSITDIQAGQAAGIVNNHLIPSDTSLLPILSKIL